MKTKLIIAAVLLALAAIALLGLRAVARAKITPPLIVHLTAATGTVERRDPGSYLWRPTKAGALLLPGEGLRTGADGRATVVFFGRAAARLDKNTEIEINKETSVAAGNLRRQTVRLEAVSGRVWSRILKFLDQGSRYEVFHSTTVATVRGTAFDFAVGADGELTIDVAENTVTVARADQTLDLTEDQRLTLPAKIAAAPNLSEAVGIIPSEAQNESWFTENNQADAQFETEAEQNWPAEETRAEEVSAPLSSIGAAVDLILTSDPSEHAALQNAYDALNATPDAASPPPTEPAPVETAPPAAPTPSNSSLPTTSTPSLPAADTTINVINAQPNAPR